MTTTQRNNSVFDTSTIPVEPRPTAQITIGGHVVTVTAPKHDVWRQVVSMHYELEEHRRLTALGAKATPEEAEKLAAITQRISEGNDYYEVMIITGRVVVDPITGLEELEGGYLSRAMSKQDWKTIRQAWKSDDQSCIDADYLFHVAGVIFKGFGSYYTGTDDEAELPEPVAPRKAAARPGAAGSRPRKSTPAKK